MNTSWGAAGSLGILVASLLVFTKTASAQSTPDAAWSLDWSRSSDAASCPDATQAAATVSEQLGHDPFVADADRQLVVELARDGATWRATIQSLDAAGTELGSQRLTSASDDCSELYQATVAALVVLLGSSHEPEPAPSPPGAEEPTSAALDETDSPPPAPTAEAQAPQIAGPATSVERPTSLKSHDNYLGLQLAVDLVWLSDAEGVCAGGSSFDCYTVAGDEFTGVPASDRGNDIVGGFVSGAWRLMIEYHHLLKDQIGLEGRAGLVIADGARGALPTHLEIGANYWLGKGVRPSRAYLGASAGFAAFDTTTRVMVVDCSTEAFPAGDPDCANTGVDTQLDAVRRAGKGFVGASIGGFVNIFRKSGLLLRFPVYVAFPDPVTVLQPSVGYGAAW